MIITVPHLLDEVLACGGTIAQLPEKDRVHFIYATDGSCSSPPSKRIGPISPLLADLRMTSVIESAQVLGVPAHNLYFLDFPFDSLKQNRTALQDVLIQLYERIQPDHVFIPFAFERHPDCSALHEAAVAAIQYLNRKVVTSEFFLSPKWNRLPGINTGELKRHDELVKIDIVCAHRVKERALRCHETQTVDFYSHNRIPAVSSRRIQKALGSKEVFLLHQSASGDQSILKRYRRWIYVVLWIEPLLFRFLSWTRPLQRIVRRTLPKQSGARSRFCL